jgi:hypothetical protein
MAALITKICFFGLVNYLQVDFVEITGIRIPNEKASELSKKILDL